MFQIQLGLKFKLRISQVLIVPATVLGLPWQAATRSQKLFSSNHQGTSSLVLMSSLSSLPKEEIHVDTFSYQCSQLEGLISESANLLVLRVMARRQAVPQDAIFLSFDTDQHICISTYNALGFQKQQVGKEEVDVFVIERSVHPADVVPLTWQFYFLSDGHLSCRVQVGSPATMVILQLPILIETDEPDPRPVFEKIPLDWEEDVQLYSKFLDRKEELQASHATYMRRHPELSALLADFLQLLLLRKPDDVVAFAAEFFAPFSVQNPPCRSFQSSDKPSPFRSRGFSWK
uniref:Ciliogenesis-associated TTC17-interacting protein n=1 Tax=Varanus komodoensis TaxID=61221 RepID=A0A8D2INM2_VARKO